MRETCILAYQTKKCLKYNCWSNFYNEDSIQYGNKQNKFGGRPAQNDRLAAKLIKSALTSSKVNIL